MHCRVFSSLTGLYPLHAISTYSPGVIHNNVSGYCQISPGKEDAGDHTWLLTNLYVIMCMVCPE